MLNLFRYLNKFRSPLNSVEQNLIPPLALCQRVDLYLIAIVNYRMATGSVAPRKDSRTAWSVADFEAERPHLTSFVRDRILSLLDAEVCNRILIRAPVKSGKREMVEYIAMRDNCASPHRLHAFLSAWHRSADEEQRKELGIHNLKVFSITTKPKAEECARWVRQGIAAGKQVVLHLDECDFGAGDRQILASVYQEFRAVDPVSFVLYSATPQEVLFSGEVEQEEYDEMVRDMVYAGEFVEYDPPAGYCGPGRFLDERLVTEAKPFFTTANNGRIHLTPQGQEVIAGLRASSAETPSRNILILRLSSSDLNGTASQRKDNKKIYQFLRGVSSCAELEGVLIIADKDERSVGASMDAVLTERIQWSNPMYWRMKATGIPMIFVIDQTASRSTELVCHDRLFAYHDFRNTVVYTTISQAQERVNHYEQRYEGFQPIRVYGHMKTFLLSAGRIDYAEYMTNLWTKRKIDHRTVTRLGLEGDLYHIKSTSDNSIHPEFNEPVGLSYADRILQDLCSFVEVKVSDRVRGRSGMKPVFGCEFVPCKINEFSAKKAQLEAIVGGEVNFRNPFVPSLSKGKVGGLWQGFLRVWKVREFSSISEKEKGWGTTGPGGSPRLTICYNNDVLGLAVRWNTGAFEEVNTLTTFKSMYSE